MKPLLIDVKKASKLLGVHQSTIRRMIDDQDIKALKIRGSLRIIYSDIYLKLKRAGVKCSQPACDDTKLFNSLVNIPFIASSLNVCSRTVTRLIASGDLGPVVPIRKTKKIKWESVTNFVNRQKDSYEKRQMGIF